MSELSDTEERLILDWIALNEPKALQTSRYFKFCKRLAESAPDEVRASVFVDFRQNLAGHAIRKFAPLVYSDLVNKQI